MCPDAAKFKIAPLQDEEHLKILFDNNVVTNVAARVPPLLRFRLQTTELLGLGSTLRKMIQVVKVKRNLLLHLCVHMDRRREHAPTHLLPWPPQR